MGSLSHKLNLKLNMIQMYVLQVKFDNASAEYWKNCGVRVYSFLNMTMEVSDPATAPKFGIVSRDIIHYGK